MTGESAIASRAGIAIGGLALAALSEDTVIAAKVHLLDCIGLIIAGNGDERVERMRRAVGSTDPAFVMSVACGVLGLDDFDEATRAHPGAVLVPALIASALSSSRAVTGADLIAALVAGYQLFGGLGRAADAGQLHLRGQHPSAFLGVPSAAGAIARLHGMPAAVCGNAIGIGASFSFGITEFDPQETMRTVQTAWAASAGLRAAGLAMAGVVPSPMALEAPGGLLGRSAAPAGSVPPDSIDLMGGTVAIERVSFKPYPHFSDLHPVTAVLIELLGARRLHPDEIERIAVRLTPRAGSRLFDGLPPRSTKEAKRSARFALASCVVQAHRTGNGAALLGAFTAERLTDDDVLAVASRVDVVLDLPEGGPSGAVELTLADGSTVAMEANGYPGDGRDPSLRWGWAEASVRFTELCASTPDTIVGIGLHDLVEDLDQVDDVRPALRELERLVAVKRS